MIRIFWISRLLTNGRHILVISLGPERERLTSKRQLLWIDRVDSKRQLSEFLSKPRAQIEL